MQVRHVIRVALAVLASVMLMFGSTSAARADVSGTVGLQDLATRYCLDSNTSRHVYTLGCNHGSFQRWVTSGPANSKQLRDLATGFCLDSNASGSVYTNSCGATNPYQKWVVTGSGSASSPWRFRNVATGRCLDSNASRHVYTLSCNGGSFQAWVRN